MPPSITFMQGFNRAQIDKEFEKDRYHLCRSKRARLGYLAYNNKAITAVVIAIIIGLALLAGFGFAALDGKDQLLNDSIKFLETNSDFHWAASGAGMMGLIWAINNASMTGIKEFFKGRPEPDCGENGIDPYQIDD